MQSLSGKAGKINMKNWIKNHWDEIILIVGITSAVLILLKANGVF